MRDVKALVNIKFSVNRLSNNRVPGFDSLFIKDLLWYR